MSEVMKLRFQQLMEEIEDLEDRIEIMEMKEPSPPELEKLLEKLAEQRNELGRISDGCGTPHRH